MVAGTLWTELMSSASAAASARSGATFIEALATSTFESRTAACHRRTRAFTRAKDRWLFEDAHSKNGSSINGTRQAQALLRTGDLLELGQTFFSFRVLIQERSDDLNTIKAPLAPEFATLLSHLERQFVELSHAAPEHDLPILLTGETGTGKEMLARTIHRLSGRSGEFMAINCGAIASSLVEAELFGVKRGAFTGASHDRQGLIRAANGGTLFLDEIGELPPASQITFLRVLQEREIIPVGGTSRVHVDFRLIAATNRDLSAPAKDPFRDDLLGRISGFAIHVPALRDHREDLALLIPTLLARHSKKREPQQFTVRALRALLLYDWPQNIRELENCLHRAMVAAAERRSTSASSPTQSNANATPRRLYLNPRRRCRRCPTT